MGSANSWVWALRPRDAHLSPCVMPGTDLSHASAASPPDWTSEFSASGCPPLAGAQGMSPSALTPELSPSFLAPSVLCSKHEEEAAEILWPLPVSQTLSMLAASLMFGKET